MALVNPRNTGSKTSGLHLKLFSLLDQEFLGMAPGFPEYILGIKARFYVVYAYLEAIVQSNSSSVWGYFQLYTWGGHFRQ